jgi:hypothetical protein
MVEGNGGGHLCDSIRECPMFLKFCDRPIKEAPSPKKKQLNKIKIGCTLQLINKKDKSASKLYSRVINLGQKCQMVANKCMNKNYVQLIK